MGNAADGWEMQKKKKSYSSLTYISNEKFGKQQRGKYHVEANGFKLCSLKCIGNGESANSA
jgi:hypothetical protein